MRHELFRAGARRAFEGDLEAAERAGRWVAATMLNDEKSLAWCRDRGIIIERAQGELTGPTGGFVVPVETSARPYYHQASAPGAEDRLAPKTWGLRRISKTSVTAIATTATMAAPTAGRKPVENETSITGVCVA